MRSDAPFTERRWLTLRKSSRGKTTRSYRSYNYLKAGLLRYPQFKNCFVSFRGSILTFVPVVAVHPATRQADYYGQRRENELVVHCTSRQYEPMSSRHLLTESWALLFNLDRPKPGKSSQVELDIPRILTPRATQVWVRKLKNYVEFELWALDGERVSDSLSLSKGPAAGVFT